MASMTRCTSNAERPDTAGWRRVCTAATKSLSTARWAVWSNAMGSAPAPLLSLAPQLKCEPFVSYLQTARLNRLLGIKKKAVAHIYRHCLLSKKLGSGFGGTPGSSVQKSLHNSGENLPSGSQWEARSFLHPIADYCGNCENCQDFQDCQDCQDCQDSQGKQRSKPTEPG